MADKQFVKGLKITKKEGQYGAFYKCGVEAKKFYNENFINSKGWINFTIFENKDGKPYAVIDLYENSEPNQDSNIVDLGDEEIPF